MLRHALCCFLILTLVGLGRPVLAKDQTVQQLKETALRALTEDAPVKVGMKDGASLKGWISMTAERSFTLANKSGSRTVSYFEVAEMKKRSSLPLKLLGVLGAVTEVVVLAIINSD